MNADKEIELRILDTLGDNASPLTIEQLWKLTDIEVYTLDRVLRKMAMGRRVRKFTEDHTNFYALPSASPATEGRGEISKQVVAFLEAHPGEGFTPYGIAKAIGRLGGSVAWTCKSMHRRGELVQVGTRPTTFALRPR